MEKLYNYTAKIGPYEKHIEYNFIANSDREALKIALNKVNKKDGRESLFQMQKEGKIVWDYLMGFIHG